MTQYMSVGDYAVTSKPIPNVVRGSEVQVTAATIRSSKVCYSAVVFNSNGEFQTFIGPIQENAFVFVRNGTPKEIEDLIGLVVNGGPKTMGKNGKRHPWACVCDDCTCL